MAYLLNKQKGSPNIDALEHTYNTPRSVSEGNLSTTLYSMAATGQQKQPLTWGNQSEDLIPVQASPDGQP